MKRHHPISMSRAINSAFDVLKMQHFEQQYGYEFVLDVISKAVQDPRVEKMRMFVLQNMDSPDPQLRRQAEEIYQQLTQVMSSGGGKISAASPLGVDPSQPPAPEGLMSTGNPQGEARPIMAKAFNAFLDAEHLRKNVIGIQETGQSGAPVQYNMPPSIASLSQRPQTPERGGFFNRPTGEMTTGPRPPASQPMPPGMPPMPPGMAGEGPVQQSQENPMDGFGGVGQMMQPPGAQVTRTPRPSPFPVDATDQHAMGEFQERHPSFSGRGFEEGNTPAYGGPAKTMDAQQQPFSGGALTDYRPTSVIPGGTQGDQFAGY